MTPPAVHPFLMSLLRGAAAPGEHDWDTIVNDAVKHGLTSIVYGWLKVSASPPWPPPEVVDRIKAVVYSQAARNLRLAQELVSILRACKDRKIACAPIRGLALAEQLYGNIAARPMGDLDLLVRREALAEAAETLRESGYREIDRRPGFARAYSYTLEFVKDRHGWVIVEPHWTIAYPPFAERIDMEALWKRCARGQVVGVEAWRLSREDLFLHLCFHLIHRREDAPLLWFYELDRLLRQDGKTFDWAHVVEVARQSGQAVLLAEVLGGLKDLFNSPIPVSQPGRSAARSMEQRMAGLLAGDSRADGRESLALFFTIKGLKAKLRYLCALLFPSPEFMRLHYGLSARRRLGLRYLARIARFAWEGLKGLAGLLVSTRPTRHSPLR
jgi:hypothetical protein